jgi:hypothetical protein
MEKSKRDCHFATVPRAGIDPGARVSIYVGGIPNRSTGSWTSDDGLCRVEFGGCPNPGDEQKFRGRPHDFLCFDEADQFPEHIVRFISGWLRTTILGQRCRMLLCFNPPSKAEGEWLLSYFCPWVDETHPRPAKTGELRWYAMVDGTENGDDLALPPDPELLSDLTAARYEPRASGLYVEEKVKIKERIGRSPDVGDAVCLALWRPRKFRYDVGMG